MSVTQSILVVEDQARERDAMVRLLNSEGYRASAASNRDEACSMIGASIDLVICDLRLGQQDGLDVLKLWRERRPSVPFLLMTAYGDVSSAVTAMKLGAIDYLTKPLKPEELLVLLNRYLPMRQNPKQSSSDDFAGLGRMIGRSSAMKEVFEKIHRVAESDAIVLITGESGTGKELVASAIHSLSRRSEAPYVAVNVSALPEALVESELFGYVRGAFTGANENRLGRFHAANGGSLFMDEVGDFPLVLQPKLLRVLETFSFSPVGSNEEQNVDVRLIAATSRNILEMVAHDQFRADLYHRLNVLNIDLPSLRQRPEDIPELIEFFLKDCARRHLRPPPEVSKELMEFLTTYEWPGNVRQLRNAIENMLVMGQPNRLTLDDLPKYLSGNPFVEPVRIAPKTLNLHDLERQAIMNALERNMGNRTHAAHTLGISVRTLQRKLKQWGVDAPPQER
jgi:DNA-binding NtrC family response regulator